MSYLPANEQSAEAQCPLDQRNVARLGDQYNPAGAVTGMGNTEEDRDECYPNFYPQMMDQMMVTVLRETLTTVRMLIKYVDLSFCKRLLSQQSHKMIIKAVLIDLSGTLHIEDAPTPNAVQALKRLRATNIIIKFVTNTTKESRTTLHGRLKKIGFELEPDEIFSSLSAAANYVKKENLNPFFLLSEDARTEFDCVNEARELDSVVVGLAPGEFHYENLNKAFNLLIANKNNRLVAIHQGKYYKRNNGLALGPGAFIKGLEYAAGTRSVLIGKPNEFFFRSAIPEGVRPEECVMIGDDPTDDVAGAMKLGLKGMQVKTGKYLPNTTNPQPPTATVENFSEAVDWLIKNIA